MRATGTDQTSIETPGLTHDVANVFRGAILDDLTDKSPAVRKRRHFAGQDVDLAIERDRTPTEPVSFE